MAESPSVRGSALARVRGGGSAFPGLVAERIDQRLDQGQGTGGTLQAAGNRDHLDLLAHAFTCS